MCEDVCTLKMLPLCALQPLSYDTVSGLAVDGINPLLSDITPGCEGKRSLCVIFTGNEKNNPSASVKPAAFTDHCDSSGLCHKSFGEFDLS